jgi:hypothetical protein
MLLFLIMETFQTHFFPSKLQRREKCAHLRCNKTDSIESRKNVSRGEVCLTKKVERRYAYINKEREREKERERSRERERFHKISS